MVVFGAPARSLQVGVGLAAAFVHRNFKVFARYKDCQYLFFIFAGKPQANREVRAP